MVAVFGSYLRPDSSQFASTQNRSLAKLKPLTRVQFLKYRMNKPLSKKGWRERIHNGGIESDFVYYPYDKLSMSGNSVTIDFRGRSRTYQMADILYAIDPITVESIGQSTSTAFTFVDIDNNSQATTTRAMTSEIEGENLVSKTFLFGTDALGRDVLSRLMAGSAVSLSVGFFAVCASVFLGLMIGLFAGYFGGIVDRMLSWSMNLFWSVPAILLVVSVTIALGTGVQALIIGIALVLWVEMAQVVRHTVLSIRLKDFVKALRLMGLSHFKILFKHIIPGLMGPIAVLASTSFAEAIMLEAGLSFLGIGVQPPQPSWGNMIRDSYGYIIAGDSAFLAIIPSTALIVLILSFVFVSNGLKEMTDVKYDRSQRGTL